MNKAAQLRDLLVKKGIVRIMGAHNGLSAKLVEEAGFDGVWASGLEISTSAAVPDASILTMTDYLQYAIQMNDAVKIPIIADCDTGYGNSSNVIRLVQKYEAAGIAGISIEDKKFPKVNSLFDGRQDLASIGEFVGKIIAAKSTQKSPDFMVIARVEALIAGWGMDEALLRSYEYERAGADAILIHHKKPDPSPVLEFIDRWDGNIPIVLVPTNYPSLTESEMKKSGKVKLVIYANHGIRSVIPALRKTYAHVFENGIGNIDSKISPLSEVFELQGMPELKANEEKYSDKSAEKVRAIIPGAGDYSSESTFKEILRDQPLLMLDLYGKPLIQHAIQSLNKANVFNITVILGPHPESVRIDNAQVITNPDYKNTFILDSLMRARNDMDCKTIIAFSDLVFDSTIITRLLRSDSEITLAVDPTLLKLHHDKILESKPDLVIAEKQPSEDLRVMPTETRNRILKIGKKTSLSEANFEFIGLACLSRNAVTEFKKVYDELVDSNPSPFHETESFKRASLTDMFQELIDRGVETNALEVRSGWSEIRDFKDYQRLTKEFAGKGQ